MKVKLEFFDHIDWSDEQIEDNISKIVKYLDEHSIEHSEEPEETDSLVIEIPKKQFDNFYTFFTSQLNGTPNCIHIVYQTVCINGEGNIELINEFNEVDELALERWQIKKLPRFNPRVDR